MKPPQHLVSAAKAAMRKASLELARHVGSEGERARLEREALAARWRYADLAEASS